MKKFLFIVRQPPYTGGHVQESLDMILTAAAFDQPVAILLLDDGVFQLKTGQQPHMAGLKDTSAIYQALSLYDIKNLFVETESLQERGLTAADLLLPIRLHRRHDLPVLIKQFDVFVSA